MRLPVQALPFIRPRCCFRNLTFFGINMRNHPLRQRRHGGTEATEGGEPSLPALLSRVPASLSSSFSVLSASLWRRLPLLQSAMGPQRVLLALVDPAAHADLAEAGARLGHAVVDVRPQGVQRQLAVQVPLGAGDLGA